MSKISELKFSREIIEEEIVRILDRITSNKKKSWMRLGQSGLTIYKTRFSHLEVAVEVSLVIGENGPMLIIKEDGPNPTMDTITIVGSEMLDNLVESVNESVEENKA